MLRTKDAANVVEFWSTEQQAHDGVGSMFKEHFVLVPSGDRGYRYWQQPEIPGVRGKHN